MVLNGEILPAFEKHYSNDILMEEGGDQRKSYEANGEYEEQLVNAMEEFYGAEVKSVAVDKDISVSFVECFFDFTLEGDGRQTFNQVAVQTWEDGQIVNEKFYKLDSILSFENRALARESCRGFIGRAEELPRIAL